MGLDKEYKATIKLGITTDTWDVTGRIIKEAIPAFYSRKDLEALLKKFEGEQYQTPPMFSALKYKGRPLYSYAREGKSVKVEKKKINISSIDFLNFKNNQLTLNINCSSGTYIRWLAQELGSNLGCGAALQKLIRTRIGNFYLKDSVEVSQVREHGKDSLLGIDKALKGCPQVIIKPEFEFKFEDGHWLREAMLVRQDYFDLHLKEDSMVMVKDSKNNLRAVYKVSADSQRNKGILRPVLILT